MERPGASINTGTVSHHRLKEKHASEVLNTVKQLVKDEKPDAYIVGTDSDVKETVSITF